MGNSTLTMGKRSKEVQAEDPQDHTDPISKQKKVAAKEAGEEATMDSLVKNAECIVCYDVPRGHVYSCKNGHIICHTCEARLKSTNRGQVFNCPECRVPYTGCRNLFVSKFLEYYYRETPLKCKFMGCDFTALLKDLLGHENLCIVRDVNCPGVLVNQCNWRGSAKGLSLHLKEHGCVFIHAHPPLRAIRDKNEISFIGELHNTNGSTFFQFRGNRIVKPILLMSPAIYRMFPFLLIERSYNGRWVLNV